MLKIEKIIQELLDKNKNIENACLVDSDGKKIFETETWEYNDEETSSMLDTWNSHGPRIQGGGIGFSILRSEPEQLIARNVAGKGAIVGSITKNKSYLIAKLAPVSAEQMGRDYFDVARAAGKID